jgi:hypothetical protein
MCNKEWHMNFVVTSRFKRTWGKVLGYFQANYEKFKPVTVVSVWALILQWKVRWTYQWLLSSTLSFRTVYFSLRNPKRNCQTQLYPARICVPCAATPLHISVLSPDCLRDVAVWSRSQKLRIWVRFIFFWCFQFHVWRTELWRNVDNMGKVRVRGTICCSQLSEGCVLNF